MINKKMTSSITVLFITSLLCFTFESSSSESKASSKKKATQPMPVVKQTKKYASEKAAITDLKNSFNRIFLKKNLAVTSITKKETEELSKLEQSIEDFILSLNSDVQGLARSFIQFQSYLMSKLNEFNKKFGDLQKAKKAKNAALVKNLEKEIDDLKVNAISDLKTELSLGLDDDTYRAIGAPEQRSGNIKKVGEIFDFWRTELSGFVGKLEKDIANSLKK